MTSYSLQQTAPLLSAADEVALSQVIEAGTEAQDRIDAGQALPDDSSAVAAGLQARRRFIGANLRLVFSLASKMKLPDHVDRQDAIQDGMVGLDKAVTKFDWRKGYKFSTYATWWIRQTMQRGLENTASTVRIPAERTSELRQMLAGHHDTPAGLPPKVAAVAALTNVDSLDRVVGDATTIGELTASEAESPDATFEAMEDQRAVQSLLAQLEPVTAAAVIARFGLDGGEPTTYTAIGRNLGVTPEAARRRIMRALERLRPEAERLTSTASPSSTGPAPAPSMALAA